MIRALGQHGPLTGAELGAAVGDDAFAQWKACTLSPWVAVRRVGRRYLRLDQRVEGYARLSPSILREFLTYTVVALAEQEAALERRAQELRAHIEEVSRRKLDMARGVATTVGSRHAAGTCGEPPFCIVVAGDIVYEMAHDVPRPERSTGSMVRGSDLDIVTIVEEDAPEELIARLDDSIYEKKYRYLINPAFREEIDYVIKRLSRLREQSEFNTFKKMVACKIFDEAVLLFGSEYLFREAKELLRCCGVAGQLQEMEQSAITLRERAEDYLLSTEQHVLQGEDLYLFYTAAESDEFE
ncbi:MAG: hypothetical protein GXX83_10410 [Gaiellales bacterium]|nr:hypothetical protein [Gaiellales bacterium]